MGVRGNRILGLPISYTGALLSYPSLPSIFAGEHWTSKFPAYVYGEVSYAKKVAAGLQLGFRLTAAIDIWDRVGLKPDVPAPQLFAPLPAGTDARNVPASFRSERGTALQAIKDGISAGGAVQPWIMFKVDLKW